jgi:hypothetical protein
MVIIRGLSWLNLVSVLRSYVIIREVMYIWHNSEVRSCNLCCSGKAVSITCSECVFVTLCSMHCACAIFSSLACPFLLYFSTLSKKRHDFRKKKIVIGRTLGVCSVGSTECQHFIVMYGGRSSFVIQHSVLFCDVGCMIGDWVNLFWIHSHGRPQLARK